MKTWLNGFKNMRESFLNTVHLFLVRNFENVFFPTLITLEGKLALITF